MQDCPSKDQLLELLADQLDEQRRESVSRHLRECASCQAVLDSLTHTDMRDELGAGTSDESTRPSQIHTAEGADGLKQLIERLKESPPDSLPTMSLAGSPPDSGGSTSISDGDKSGRRSSEASPHGSRVAESRYTIKRLLAKGGMGNVWLARDESLNRDVALKELSRPGTLVPSASQRFLREAQVTGQLNHPNIVPVHELGHDPDRDHFFYTMQVVGTRSLKDAIAEYHRLDDRDEARPLQLRRLLRAFVSICNAVAYAHSQGIVHRDLKPSNVALGEFGEVMVLDWGLAKIVGEREPESSRLQFSGGADSELTTAGSVFGSPGYMAPEQAGGDQDRIDQRTDIYGLGGILFSILTGQPPHRQTSREMHATELLEAIVDAPVPQARQHEPSTHPALDAICRQALAKEPQDRYQTATGLADDVERWLADQPVSSYAEPWSSRLARWGRRHRTWMHAAAAALTLIAAVAVIAAIAIDNSRQIERQARAAAESALLAKQSALRAEEKAKAEATQRLREATETINVSLTGVSDVLEYHPGTQALRTRLLEKAADDLTRFANQESEDPQLQAEAGRARVRLGDVYRLMARFAEAERAYRSAETQFATLALQVPQLPDFRWELANCRIKLSTLLAEYKRRKEAENIARTAIEALDRLTREHPEESKYFRSKATALLGQADLLASQGATDQAHQRLQMAEQIFRDIAARSDDPHGQQGLAAVQTALARLHSRQQRHDQAVNKLKQAGDTWEVLVKSRSDHPPYREQLAACRVCLANAMRQLGRDAEEIEAYRLAISDYRALVKARPEIPLYHESLALTQIDLAQVLHQLGANRQAARGLETALAIVRDLVQKFPSVPRYHEEFAVCQTTLGRVLCDLDQDGEPRLHDALATYESLIEAVPDEPLYRHRRAVCRSCLARSFVAQGKTATALDTLGRAIRDFDDALQHDSRNVHSIDALADTYVCRADLLRDAGRRDEAKTDYEKALSLREELNQTPVHVRKLVSILANCRDPEFRDPGRAVELAGRLTEQVPGNAQVWNALGAAHYRAGNYAASIDALTQAEARRLFPHSSDRFFLAMAYWQHGEKTQARIHFGQAVKTMDEQQPGHVQLIGRRAEAAELLGMPETAAGPVRAPKPE